MHHLALGDSVFPLMGSRNWPPASAAAAPSATLMWTPRWRQMGALLAMQASRQAERQKEVALFYQPGPVLLHAHLQQPAIHQKSYHPSSAYVTLPMGGTPQKGAA